MNDTQTYTTKAMTDINNDYLIVDIETGTCPDCEQFMPEFEPDARLKDPDKIETDIAKKRDKWKSDVKLSALTGTVLAIGLRSKDEIYLHPEVYKDELGELKAEEIILVRFWQEYAEAKTIVGHNIKGFDLPFLWRRSIKHGIKPLWNPQDRYNAKIVDTMELFKCGVYSDKYVSLNNLAKFLGVGEKNGEGNEFEALYLNPETRQQALDYLKNDLMLVNGVYRKMIGI